MRLNHWSLGRRYNVPELTDPSVMPAKVGFVRKVGVGQVGGLEQVVGPEQWFESAAVRAIAQQLESGEASVGTRLTIEPERFLTGVEAKRSHVH